MKNKDLIIEKQKELIIKFKQLANEVNFVNSHGNIYYVIQGSYEKIDQLKEEITQLESEFTLLESSEGEECKHLDSTERYGIKQCVDCGKPLNI